MVSDDGHRIVQAAEVRDDLRAVRGVALDRLVLVRLERALLEPAVRLQQLERTRAKRYRLALDRRGCLAHEECERDVERCKNRDDAYPDHALARRDETLRVLRLGIDLVRPERVFAVDTHDRRVDLEDVIEAEAAFDGILRAAELADRGYARRLAIVSPRSPSNADENRWPMRSGARFVHTSVPSG